MPNFSYERELFKYLENIRSYVVTRPMVLGGVSGSVGGSGGPPGGYIGYLPQSRVAFDTTEAEVWEIPPSGTSILDNLNRIRYRLGVLEASGVGGSGVLSFYDDGNFQGTANEVDIIGAGISVADNRATITVSGVGYSDPTVVSEVRAVDSNGLKLYESTGTNGILVKDGTVGIGTSTPEGTLDVNGMIRSLGVNVPTSGTGVELFYSAGIGFITANDRLSPYAFKPLRTYTSDYSIHIADAATGSAATQIVDVTKGNVDITGTTRIKSYTSPTAGAGLELGYSLPSSQAFQLSLDRDTGYYKKFSFYGYPLEMWVANSATSSSVTKQVEITPSGLTLTNALIGATDLGILTNISSGISTDTTSTSFVDVTNSSVSLTLNVPSTVFLFATMTATSRSGDTLVVKPFIGATGGQEHLLKADDAGLTLDAPMFVMQRVASVAAGSVTLKLQFKSLAGAQVNLYNGNVYAVGIPET